MSGYGTFPAYSGLLQLATKGPTAYLDYTESVQYPLTNPVTGLVDPLTSLELYVAPSGAGELVASRLTVDSTGFLVTWWLADGIAGRNYVINLLGTTEAGRIFQWDFGILISPLLATYPLPPAPNTGFGTPITWVATGVEFGLLGADGAQLLGADGAPLQYAH